MTLNAVSSLRILYSSFFFNFCEALRSNLKRVEDGKELIVDVQMSFSLAFLCKTAAESAKDARSLAGSWNVVDGSTLRMAQGTKEYLCVPCTLWTRCFGNHLLKRMFLQSLHANLHGAGSL